MQIPSTLQGESLKRLLQGAAAGAGSETTASGPLSSSAIARRAFHWSFVGWTGKLRPPVVVEPRTSACVNVRVVQVTGRSAARTRCRQHDASLGTRVRYANFRGGEGLPLWGLDYL